MSAELLREAAALMRTRAEAYPDERDAARVDIDHHGTCDGCAESKPLVASYPEPDNEPWLCAECAAAADYIASWHPAVALAMASLLNQAADTGTGWLNVELVGLARAYLGRDS